MPKFTHLLFFSLNPDDNFLVIIRGRKRVRLFGHHNLQSLYPNPLGSYGKTIQSRVDLDNVDPVKFPSFAHPTNGKKLVCQQTVLQPGEMLFIPAFYWHQVSCSWIPKTKANSTYIFKLMSIMNWCNFDVLQKYVQISNFSAFLRNCWLQHVIFLHELQSNSIIVENSIIVDNLPSTEDFYFINIQNSRTSNIEEVFLGKVAWI